MHEISKAKFSRIIHNPHDESMSEANGHVRCEKNRVIGQYVLTKVELWEFLRDEVQMNT